MTKFRHKNGGICEVYTQANIDKLRKDPNYKEILENSKKESKVENKSITDNLKNTENKN